MFQLGERNKRRSQSIRLTGAQDAWSQMERRMDQRSHIIFVRDPEFELYHEGDREVSTSGVELHFYHVDV